MFYTFADENVNSGSSAIFIREHILPDHSIVTHEMTFQGRDHIVRIHCGASLLVVINCILSLTCLHERPSRIVFYQSRYPEGFGMIIGDFNNCEPEEVRFIVRHSTFTEGDAGKTAMFRTFSRRSAADVRCVRYPELTERY